MQLRRKIRRSSKIIAGTHRHRKPKCVRRPKYCRYTDTPTALNGML